MRFEEIMSYHVDNQRVYDNIKRNYSLLIPFVGSGLSAFYYPTWGETLYRIFDKLQWPEKKEDFDAMLKRYEYEEAAEFLLKHRGLSNFIADVKEVFSQMPEVDYRSLKQQAVYILPLLFPKNVFTTNYDRVVERVYKDRDIDLTIAHPGHSNILTTAIRTPDTSVLYKFHGDIHDWDNLILTKSQYDKHYIESGDIVKELKQCFESRPMLFLGCSLNADRTMAILSDIFTPAIINYAILSCQMDRIRVENKRLADMGIQAIFYPDKKHEAVRVILERLLEDIDPECHKYYSKLISTTELKSTQLEIMDVNFVGKTAELERLEGFINSKHEKNLLWWALTGQGGTGKTRLAKEFLINIEKENWNSLYLDRGDYKDLGTIGQKITGPTVIVMDNANSSIKEIITWIESLQNTTKKVRLLLIEREGDSFTNSKWGKYLHYNATSDFFANSCFENNFLKVDKLNDSELKQIIKMYSELIDKSMSLFEIGKVIKNLELIDPIYMRPLYGLLLVELWENGSNNENKVKLLESIIERERTLIKFGTRQCIDTNLPNAFDKILLLKCIATVKGEIAVLNNTDNYIKRYFDDISEYLSKKWTVFVEEAKNCGLFDPKSSCIDRITPDIVGEYFVLFHLKNLKETEMDEFNQLVDYLWKSDRDKTKSFLVQLLKDFEQNICEDDELVEKLLFPDIDMSHAGKVADAMFYYDELVDSMIPQIMVMAIRKMEYIIKNHSFEPFGKMFIDIYSNALVNLSRVKDREILIEAFQKIEALYLNNLSNEEVAVCLAGVVANISGSNIVKVTNMKQIMEKLYSECADNRRLIEIYSRNLCNSLTEDTCEERNKLIQQVRLSYNQDTNSVGLAEVLVKELHDKMVLLDGIECDVELREIENLQSKFPTNIFIAYVFALSLNLYGKNKSKEDKLIILNTIKALLVIFNYNYDIAVAYTNYLLNLSTDLTNYEMLMFGSELHKLLDEYCPRKEYLDSLRARVYYNMSLCQDNEGVKNSYNEIRVLGKRYLNSVKFTVLLDRIKCNYSDLIFE